MYTVDEILARLAAAAQDRRDAAAHVAKAEEAFQQALKDYAEFKKNNGSDDPGNG